MPRNKCEPDCRCGLHTRSRFHNELIGRSVSRTARAKGLSTEPRNVRRRKP